MRKLSLALIAAASIMAPAYAQNAMETVVTTSRSSFERHDKDMVPYTVLVRRADNLINAITVSDDTRDPVLRRQEMRDTLKALVREAKRHPRISLSIGDTQLTTFSEDMVERYAGGGSFGDVSRTRLLVKTAISSSDTFESASERIKAFVRAVPKFGRSETFGEAVWNVTIINPQQYHDAVVAKIAAEARQSAAKFGPDYGAIVDGLYEPLQWYRVDELNLALFLRYTMVIAQKGTGKVVVPRTVED
jgi:hypothetical protein